VVHATASRLPEAGLEIGRIFHVVPFHLSANIASLVNVLVK